MWFHRYSLKNELKEHLRNYVKVGIMSINVAIRAIL